MKKLLLALTLVFSLFANAQKKEVTSDSVFLYINKDTVTPSYQLSESQEINVKIFYTADSVWINNARHSVISLEEGHIEKFNGATTEWHMAKDEKGVTCVVTFMEVDADKQKYILITYSNIGITYKIKPAELPSI